MIEEAGDYEEDINPRVPPPKVGEVDVIEHNTTDGDCPEALNVGTESVAMGAMRSHG